MFVNVWFQIVQVSLHIGLRILTITLMKVHLGDLRRNNHKAQAIAVKIANNHTIQPRALDSSAVANVADLGCGAGDCLTLGTLDDGSN